MVGNSIKNSKKAICEQHPFHLVDPSIWPFLVSFAALFFTTNFVYMLSFYMYSEYTLLYSFILLLAIMLAWFGDIINEGVKGEHTLKVEQGLRYGMLLFIVSEVMFFFSFFWAFFHSSLSPTWAIACVWPPQGIKILDPLHLPTLNTLILLTSGITITRAHYGMQKVVPRVTDKVLNVLNNYNLEFTIALGVLFTALQAVEYIELTNKMAGSLFGSLFFMCTGFHGAHVIIGTVFLFVCYIRQYLGHFTTYRHFGFEAAAWYWHFVDVVWLFLYVTIYWWGI